MAQSELVRYNTKLVAMATSLEESEKSGPDEENSRKYLPFGEKIVKISPVDTKIALLIVKKEEINASKIDSPSASLPSGLNNGAKLLPPLHLSLFHSQTVWDNAAYVQD